MCFTHRYGMFVGLNVLDGSAILYCMCFIVKVSLLYINQEFTLAKFKMMRVTFIVFYSFFQTEMKRIQQYAGIQTLTDHMTKYMNLLYFMLFVVKQI